MFVEVIVVILFIFVGFVKLYSVLDSLHFVGFITLSE